MRCWQDCQPHRKRHREREREILHSVSWKNLGIECHHPVKHTPPLMIQTEKCVLFTLICKHHMNLSLWLSVCLSEMEENDWRGESRRFKHTHEGRSCFLLKYHHIKYTNLFQISWHLDYGFISEVVFEWLRTKRGNNTQRQTPLIFQTWKSALHPGKRLTSKLPHTPTSCDTGLSAGLCSLFKRLIDRQCVCSPVNTAKHSLTH